MANRRRARNFPIFRPIPNAGQRCLVTARSAMLRGWNEEILTLTIDVDADDPSPVKPAQRTIAAAFDIRNVGPADQWLMDDAG